MTVNSFIHDIIVNESYTVKSALEILQGSSKNILILVDQEDGEILRTVTDGDIRRLILSGVGLEFTLSKLESQTPVVARQGISVGDALALMNETQIDQLPVLDECNRPVDLYLRRELDSKILLSTPHLGHSERDFVDDAFRTNWIAPLGPNVDAFESEICGYLGEGYYAAALSSGTAALHLALKLLGVKSGDVVFCSSLTFVASANPILYEHATPVFIDSEPDSWNMSPQALERALKEYAARGELPKAVVIVNLYGQSADFAPLKSLCDFYAVPIVEDAAESLGASYKNMKSGTFGDIGVFSFNGNKIITTSGGGMMVSKNEDYIIRARHLSTQAREPKLYYQHTEVGYNYRMSNILAGIGRGQLKVLDERARSRRGIFKAYVEGLKEFTQLEWQHDLPNSYSTHWLSACKLPDIETAENLINFLEKHGIEARPVWKPMHLQPLFCDAVYYPHEIGRDVSQDLFQKGICLPSGSNLNRAQIDKIINGIRAFLA